MNIMSCSVLRDVSFVLFFTQAFKFRHKFIVIKREKKLERLYNFDSSNYVQIELCAFKEYSLSVIIGCIIIYNIYSIMEDKTFDIHVYDYLLRTIRLFKHIHWLKLSTILKVVTLIFWS